MIRNNNLDKPTEFQFDNLLSEKNFKLNTNYNYYNGNNNKILDNPEYLNVSQEKNYQNQSRYYNQAPNQQVVGNYFFSSNNQNNELRNEQNQFFYNSLKTQTNSNNSVQTGNFPQKFSNNQQYQPQLKPFNQFEQINSNKLQNEEFNLIQSLNYVKERYGHLIEINENNIGLTQIVKNQVHPRFFVIKSFTEEDIHKSIKYNVWSSTKEGNKKLNNYYDDSRLKNSDVFLFFSMNASGRFVGVARMASNVDFNMEFDYWAMDEVWKGLMKVEWLFVKDVPNKFLKEIKLSNNSNKPVTNSRDTQEILRKEGEQMLQLFENISYQTNIFQHFQYYDERQDLFEKTKKAPKYF